MNYRVIVKSSGGGIGFLGALTILFIALKLLNQIGWSWWWVLAPIWVPFAIVIIILFVFLGLAILVMRRSYWSYER
jgi:uncharacterized membrane protein